MSYDNSPLPVERNIAGFWCRSEHMDRAKSVLGVWHVLDHKSIAANLTGTVAETQLYQRSIPGGLLGPNGVLRLSIIASNTGSVSQKTLRVKLGGTNVYSLDNAASAANVSMCPMFALRNRGDEQAQIASPQYASGVSAGATGAVQFLAVDTTVDQLLTITGQLASGADFLRLESVLVEVLAS